MVCTIGPASRSVEGLAELLEAGMTLARFDLTWGSLDYHKQSLRNLSQAMQDTGILCAAIVDIVGREVPPPLSSERARAQVGTAGESARKHTATCGAC